MTHLGQQDDVFGPLAQRRQRHLERVFLEEIGRTVGRPAAGLSQDARDRLFAYRWPGNVRELKNAIERAVILSEGGLITGEHLPLATRSAPSAGSSTGVGTTPKHTGLHDLQRALVEKVLTQTSGNRSSAARRLGISRGELYTLLRRYSLG